MTMTKKKTYEGNSFQLQILSLTLFFKNFSLFQLSHSHISTVSLDKLTCTDYVDFGKLKTYRDNFFGPKLIPTTRMINLKFSRETTTNFHLVQNLTMGEADLNQFLRLKNQFDNAAGNYGKEENMSPVLIPTMSKDKNEHLKRAHKVIDVVKRD